MAEDENERRDAQRQQPTGMQRLGKAVGNMSTGLHDGKQAAPQEEDKPNIYIPNTMDIERPQIAPPKTPWKYRKLAIRLGIVAVLLLAFGGFWLYVRRSPMKPLTNSAYTWYQYAGSALPEGNQSNMTTQPDRPPLPKPLAQVVFKADHTGSLQNRKTGDKQTFTWTYSANNLRVNLAKAGPERWTLAWVTTNAGNHKYKGFRVVLPSGKKFYILRRA
ncbi:hypothetical protein [Lacticaseibacillus yichunensis]|uniref:Uncharacterized protein n=1 Tax=Lacticaseibacillus yichunensis TaxID=2486015 RepID=A0ABW4CQ43_9LACO|nr:hypothetical protein [Lacticaseibacillus yichunensis]